MRPTRTSVAVMTSSVIQKVLRDGPPLRSVPPQDEREKGESVCAEEPLRSSKWRLEASLAQQIPSDDHPHHLVGAFEDRMDAQVAQATLDRIILQIAVAAEQLERVVEEIGRAACRARVCKYVENSVVAGL